MEPSPEGLAAQRNTCAWRMLSGRVDPIAAMPMKDRDLRFLGYE
jgi:hypothetical protein